MSLFLKLQKSPKKGLKRSKNNCNFLNFYKYALIFVKAE